MSRKYDVWADGQQVKDESDIPDSMRDGAEDAYNRLVEFLYTGFLKNIEVESEIFPARGTAWAEPDEAFASRTGSPKYIATTVLIKAESWLRIQAETHNQSVSGLIADVTESTAEAVTEALNTLDDRTLSEIPMPVLEIDMDRSSNHAEGRSRGVGVSRSEEEFIPVRVVSRVYR